MKFVEKIHTGVVSSITFSAKIVQFIR